MNRNVQLRASFLCDEIADRIETELKRDKTSPKIINSIGSLLERLDETLVRQLNYVGGPVRFSNWKGAEGDILHLELREPDMADWSLTDDDEKVHRLLKPVMIFSSPVFGLTNEDWLDCADVIRSWGRYIMREPDAYSGSQPEQTAPEGPAVISLPPKAGGGLESRLDSAEHELPGKQKEMFHELRDMKPHRIPQLATSSQSDEAAKKMLQRIANKLSENPLWNLDLSIKANSVLLIDNLSGQIQDKKTTT